MPLPQRKKRKVGPESLENQAKLSSAAGEPDVDAGGASLAKVGSGQDGTDTDTSDSSEDGRNSSEAFQEEDGEDVTGHATRPQRHAGNGRGRQHVPLYSNDGLYTGEIYKSNAFKLQVDDLLKGVRIREGEREALAEKAVHDVKSIIEKIPSREELLVSFSAVIKELC